MARNDDAEAKPATNRLQGQVTSDFQKPCQARESKIFRFRSRPNQSHNSACLTADEGRSRTSRTRGEMRWTREPRLTCAACAYGEVVWFGRRGAGVKRAIRSAGDGGKRAVLREEHEVSRKAIAQGRPGCSRRTCMLVCSLCYAQSHTGPRVRRAPGLPRALYLEGGRFSSKARAEHVARSPRHTPLSSPGFDRATQYSRDVSD